MLFEEHLDKENDLVLPLIAASSEVSLAGLLDGMHDILGGHDDTEGHAAAEGGQQSGGACGCGGHDEADVPNWTPEPSRTPCATPRSSAPSTPFPRAAPWC
ncbi:hypothetical protein ACR6C2_30295 [Streptomyces sp. INA 01156]